MITADTVCCVRLFLQRIIELGLRQVKVLEGCELSANSLQLVLDKIEWEKTSAT